MTAAWLSDAATGEGSALARLRQHVAALLKVRDHPLHVGSIITSVVGGWDGSGYPEDVFDHPELFEPVGNNSTRTLPVPPGALAVVPTATKLGDLYGEVVCSHPDPDAEQYDAAGQLVADGATRHRAVIAFDCMPEGLQLPLDAVEMDRIRRTGTWLTGDGHVRYRASANLPEDTLELYCRWLAHPSRTAVRIGLPDDPSRLRAIAATLLDELAGYRATFVTFGRWVWLRDRYESLLDATGGRLNRDELRRTLGLLSATYGSSHALRTVAFELADAAADWDTDEREQATAGTRWVRSLFVANAFIAERLSGGAPIVHTRDGPVRLVTEPAWDLAGLWHVDTLTGEEVHQLQAAARAEAEDRSVAAMGRELARVAPFPFSMRLSEEQFEHGYVELPAAALEHLADGPVTVRLAFRPQGRFAAWPVAAATTGDPRARRLPMDWPALLPVGTLLDGRVTRRGGLVELQPV